MSAVRSGIAPKRGDAEYGVGTGGTGVAEGRRDVGTGLVTSRARRGALRRLGLLLGRQGGFTASQLVPSSLSII